MTNFLMADFRYEHGHKHEPNFNICHELTENACAVKE